ncbi:hypothetical protein [Bacillus cereus]|uniref:hypothetical protein n=1 Tax=Bacillus cereus TaxID=1396 RepID=UPI001F0B63C4|nr:hypothetical protein [Bacillus cereus]
MSFSNNFQDEPIQQVISEARATYGALDEGQKERFCNQLLLIIQMIREHPETF